MPITAKVVGLPQWTNLLHLDLSQELNDATSICKLDIQEHFKDHKRIDNDGALKPLAPSTIYSKLHAGGAGLEVRLERAALRKKMKEERKRRESEKPFTPFNAPKDPNAPKKPAKPKVKKPKAAKKKKRYTDAQAAKVRAHAYDPMIATENLMFNQKITKATRNKQEATIEIGPTRAEIYSYLEDERPVFGISEGVSEKVDQMVEARVDRILRKVFND